MSITIAVVLVLMEEFSVIIGQKLIIQKMIDHIEKVRHHVLTRLNEPSMRLNEAWQIPAHELCDALGVDMLDEIMSSKIRGIAYALTGEREYHPRSLAAGAKELIKLLEPAAREERETDESELRSRILELAARYSSMAETERTMVLVALEGSRTRSTGLVEEVTQLVRLRLEAETEYTSVLEQLRERQINQSSSTEPLSDPRYLQDADLKLHTHLYREEVRKLNRQFNRRDAQRYDQLQEAS